MTREYIVKAIFQGDLERFRNWFITFCNQLVNDLIFHTMPYCSCFLKIPYLWHSFLPALKLQNCKPKVRYNVKGSLGTPFLHSNFLFSRKTVTNNVCKRAGKKTTESAFLAQVKISVVFFTFTACFSDINRYTSN